MSPPRLHSHPGHPQPHSVRARHFGPAWVAHLTETRAWGRRRGRRPRPYLYRAPWPPPRPLSVREFNVLCKHFMRQGETA